MSKLILVTTSDVAAGHETDFNAWYETTHIPEILACPGFVAASRWECVEGEPRHLALYELEREDAIATPEVRAVWGWGPMAPFLRNSHGRVYRQRFEASAPGFAA